MGLLKRFVIISMSLSFLVLACTGITRVPEIQKYFLFIYDYVPASLVALLHDWSGVALVISIIVHLVIKRAGLKEAFFIGRKLSLRTVKVFYGIIGIALSLVVIVLIVNSNFFTGKQPIQLSAVEITEYQGEKLGSINDFRENSIKGPQHVNKSQYRLEIAGLISPSVSLEYDQVLSLPTHEKIVTLNCVEGWSVKALWEGVLVRDLLRDLIVDPSANTIIFYAADGYSTSFPLDYVMKNDIIMADKLNGVELPPERGFPFQLVAEDKWGYKWIKWITKIEISDDPSYKGFWESRGYNNDGDQSGSKFAQ